MDSATTLSRFGMRTKDGRFSFTHQSFFDWFLAWSLVRRATDETNFEPLGASSAAVDQFLPSMLIAERGEPNS